jgi:hypothetical protein
MKRKVIQLLIIVALLAAPLTVGAAGQNTITVEEIKGRAAEAQAKRREVVAKLRPGTKILVGDKAFPFEFMRSANLSGRIKEMRENDFTLSSTSPRKGEVIAVISYADVLSIKHPSGFEKALKNVGKYAGLGAAAVPLAPLFLIADLLGLIPKC